MSDQNKQNNERRAQLRRQRERQYAIDAIIARYLDAYHSGQLPRIEDYVQRYPQYTSELLEFAVYFHTIGFATESLEGPSDLELSPAAEKAFARIREQQAAYAPTPSIAPIEGLVKQGIAVGYTPLQLAEAVGLTPPLLGKLEARAIAGGSIPRALFQRLAATLKTAPEAIAAYLGVTQPGQAGGFYYASQPPAQQQETFLDAVQASALSPERKQEWAEIVQEDVGASE